METKSNLDLLRELTYNLPDMSKAFDIQEDGSGVFHAQAGHLQGWKMYADKEFAIHRWYNSAGTVMQAHTHNAIEAIIILSGRIRVWMDDTEHILIKGDTITIPLEKIHAVEVLEDTWDLTVTIPPAMGFPK